MYSVSCFNLGSIGALFEGAKPPRGDGTGQQGNHGQNF